jgi:hypothetical protein
VPLAGQTVVSSARNMVRVFPHVKISRVADVLLAGQTVVSSARVIVWVFPHVKISRGADVLLAGHTVLAINVSGPNRGTQNTLAAVVGNVNTRSIV